MNHMCEISPSGLKGGKLGVIFTLANIPTASCQGAGLRFAVTEFTGVATPPPPFQSATKPPHMGSIINPGPGLTQRYLRPVGGPQQSTHTYTHAHCTVHIHFAIYTFNILHAFFFLASWTHTYTQAHTSACTALKIYKKAYLTVFRTHWMDSLASSVVGWIMTDDQWWLNDLLTSWWIVWLVE